MILERAEFHGKIILKKKETQIENILQNEISGWLIYILGCYKTIWCVIIIIFFLCFLNLVERIFWFFDYECGYIINL